MPEFLVCPLCDKCFKIPRQTLVEQLGSVRARFQFHLEQDHGAINGYEVLFRLLQLNTKGTDRILKFLDTLIEEVEKSGDISLLMCPYCGAKFSSKRSLNCHRKEKHSRLPQIFPCSECGKEFSSKLNLKAHRYMLHNNTSKEIVRREDEDEEETYVKMESSVKMEAAEDFEYINILSEADVGVDPIEPNDSRDGEGKEEDYFEEAENHDARLEQNYFKVEANDQAEIIDGEDKVKKVHFCVQCDYVANRRGDLTRHKKAIHEGVNQEQELSKSNNSRKGLRRAIFTPEERKFCFESYKEFGGEQGWYHRLSESFVQQFPTATSVPSKGTVLYIINKFDKSVISSRKKDKKHQVNSGEREASLDITSEGEEITDFLKVEKSKETPLEHKSDDPRKGKKSPLFTPEERKFAVEIYKENGGIQGWYKSFSILFRHRFPNAHRVPSLKIIGRFLENFEKYGNYESRIRKGMPKKKRYPQSRICEECGYEGKDRIDIRLHRKRKHNPGWTCPDCGKTMLTEKRKGHEQMHLPESERRFQCSQCVRGFGLKCYLDQHFSSVHSEDRPHVCQFMCGYACKSAGNLRKHELICKMRTN